MKKYPIHVVLWRFDQISIFLDKRLTLGERSRMIDDVSRISVIWPNGSEGTVPRSTLYRWRNTYNKNPVIESLMPKSKPKSEAEKVIKEE